MRFEPAKRSVWCEPQIKASLKFALPVVLTPSALLTGHFWSNIIWPQANIERISTIFPIRPSRKSSLPASPPSLRRWHQVKIYCWKIDVIPSQFTNWLGIFFHLLDYHTCNRCHQSCYQQTLHIHFITYHIIDKSASILKADKKILILFMKSSRTIRKHQFKQLMFPHPPDSTVWAVPCPHSV